MQVTKNVLNNIILVFLNKSKRERAARRKGSRLTLAFVAALVAYGSSLSLVQNAYGTEINSFQDPIDTPAMKAEFAAAAPMLAVTRAGSRVVAVGLRGQTVFSDDSGNSWTQAEVPVDSDLIAVSFATPMHGWAIGHLGVLLETTDGGEIWRRRFGGQELNESAVGYYEALPRPLAPAAEQARDAAAWGIENKVPPSLLDVWFWTPSSGVIVGEFNMIFRTDDGGKTWVPQMDRTDNPDGLHFYEARGSKDGLFMTGERGQVWRLDNKTQRWESVPTGYDGTLFGLVVDGERVVAFGMCGSVYFSDSSGDQWEHVAMPSKAGIVDGLQLNGRRILLADQTGRYFLSKNGGRTFSVSAVSKNAVAYSLAQGKEERLFWAGPSGVGEISVK